MMPCHPTWPAQTRKWCHSTGSDQEVAVEGQKLTFWARFRSYRSLTCRRLPSHERKWRHVTPRTGSNLEVMSFHRKWPGSGCRRSKTHGLGVFPLLQGFNSKDVVVTWKKMMSCDLMWPEITRKWHHLRGSDREGALEIRKHVVWGVSAPTGLQLAGGGSNVTVNDITWPHVTGCDPEVT